jgi:hypothetical protein
VATTTPSPSPSIPTLTPTSTPTLPPSITPTPKITKRITLTPEVYNKIPFDDLCDMGFEWDIKADRAVVFKDSEITFNVPFSDKWGNDKYSLNPYDAIYENNTLKSVAYGQMMGGEGCGFRRRYRMTVSPLQSLESVKSELNKAHGAPYIYEDPPRITTIKGFKLLFYREEGMGAQSYAIFSGSNHNFEFTGWDEETILSWINSLNIE